MTLNLPKLLSSFISMVEDPILTTLGLFIIDANHYPDSWNRKSEYNIIGGGASYAIVGGRITAGPVLGKRICGIIDKGSDFPQEVEDEINSWGTGSVFRLDPSRLTTRGANVYGEDGVRTFVYLSPKKRIEGFDVLETDNLVQLRSFHFCCAVERCEETIDLFLNTVKGNGKPKPLFVFEPFPEVCITQNLDRLNKMLYKVDVFTPNLTEATDFVGLPKMPETEAGIAELALKFLEHMSPDGGVVLRCGELGCYVLTKDLGIMLPAYHTDQAKVVDVTGGGNSFCGGFVTALYLSHGDWLVAGIFGNLTSGCIVEALGMPQVKPGELEEWNRLDIKSRLHNYINANSVLLADFDLARIDWI